MHPARKVATASIRRRFIGLPSRVDTRLVRFVLVGLGGIGVSTSVLWFSTRGMGLSTVWGGAMAAVISTFTNFLLNDAFTWRDRKLAGWRAKAGRLVQYYATIAVGNLIYLVVLTVLVHWGRLFDLLANLIAIGVGGTFNYLIHNAWTWRGGELT